eukprot:SAG31_NODE_8657_length_1411_cov_2.364329_2_plen_194_part_00
MRTSWEIQREKSHKKIEKVTVLTEDRAQAGGCMLRLQHCTGGGCGVAPHIALPSSRTRNGGTRSIRNCSLGSGAPKCSPKRRNAARLAAAAAAAAGPARALRGGLVGPSRTTDSERRRARRRRAGWRLLVAQTDEVPTPGGSVSAPPGQQAQQCKRAGAAQQPRATGGARSLLKTSKPPGAHWHAHRAAAALP